MRGGDVKYIVLCNELSGRKGALECAFKRTVTAAAKRSNFARRAYQPDKARNAVGPQLRRVRDALGWSQENLAAKCHLRGWDMDRVMVAKIELRLRSITDLELLKLCEVTGASPAEMLGLQPFPGDPERLRRHLKALK